MYTVANTVDKETLEKELREAFRLFDKEVIHWFRGTFSIDSSCSRVMDTSRDQP